MLLQQENALHVEHARLASERRSQLFELRRRGDPIVQGDKRLRPARLSHKRGLSGSELRGQLGDAQVYGSSIARVGSRLDASVRSPTRRMRLCVWHG